MRGQVDVQDEISFCFMPADRGLPDGVIYVGETAFLSRSDIARKA